MSKRDENRQASADRVSLLRLASMTSVAFERLFLGVRHYGGPSSLWGNCQDVPSDEREQAEESDAADREQLDLTKGIADG